MGGHRRQEAENALQRMYGNVGVIVVDSGRLPAGKKAVGINTMDDLHVMAPMRQLIREPMHENAVPAEVVGRVECCNHAEAK